MRGFDRDLIRGKHYGQRSCEPHLKGRTHGCTDQVCYAKILLANPEPSTHGTKRTLPRAEPCLLLEEKQTLHSPDGASSSAPSAPAIGLLRRNDVKPSGQ